MEVDGHTHLTLAMINFMVAVIIGKVAPRAPAGKVQSHESMATASEENNKELEASFLKAVDDNQGIINKMCRAYCNTRADREDLCQEIVCQLWKAYPSFDGSGKVSSWIHTIALRIAIVPFRDRDMKVELEFREELPDLAAEEETPQADSSDRFFKLFYRLGDIDGAILTLLYEGYNKKEIASQLHLQEAAVKMRMSRIRKIINER